MSELNTFNTERQNEISMIYCVIGRVRTWIHDNGYYLPDRSSSPGFLPVAMMSPLVARGIWPFV